MHAHAGEISGASRLRLRLLPAPARCPVLAARPPRDGLRLPPRARVPPPPPPPSPCRRDLRRCRRSPPALYATASASLPERTRRRHSAFTRRRDPAPHRAPLPPSVRRPPPPSLQPPFAAASPSSSPAVPEENEWIGKNGWIGLQCHQGYFGHFN